MKQASMEWTHLWIHPWVWWNPVRSDQIELIDSCADRCCMLACYCTSTILHSIVLYSTQILSQTLLFKPCHCFCLIVILFPPSPPPSLPTGRKMSPRMSVFFPLLCFPLPFFPLLFLPLQFSPLACLPLPFLPLPFLPLLFFSLLSPPEMAERILQPIFSFVRFLHSFYLTGSWHSVDSRMMQGVEG